MWHRLVMINGKQSTEPFLKFQAPFLEEYTVVIPEVKFGDSCLCVQDHLAYDVSFSCLEDQKFNAMDSNSANLNLNYGEEP